MRTPLLLISPTAVDDDSVKWLMSRMAGGAAVRVTTPGFASRHCDGEAVLVGSSGTFASGPAGKRHSLSVRDSAQGLLEVFACLMHRYCAGLACAWHISLPEEGAEGDDAVLVLTFARFELECATSLDGQPLDAVRVYDGGTRSAPLLGTFFCYSPPPFLVASGRQLLVEMESDGESTTFGGFEASWSSSSRHCAAGTCDACAAGPCSWCATSGSCLPGKGPFTGRCAASNTTSVAAACATAPGRASGACSDAGRAECVCGLETLVVEAATACDGGSVDGGQGPIRPGCEGDDWRSAADSRELWRRTEVIASPLALEDGVVTVRVETDDGDLWARITAEGPMASNLTMLVEVAGSGQATSWPTSRGSRHLPRRFTPSSPTSVASTAASPTRRPDTQSGIPLLTGESIATLRIVSGGAAAAAAAACELQVLLRRPQPDESLIVTWHLSDLFGSVIPVTRANTSECSSLTHSSAEAYASCAEADLPPPISVGEKHAGVIYLTVTTGAAARKGGCERAAHACIDQPELRLAVPGASQYHGAVTAGHGRMVVSYRVPPGTTNVMLSVLSRTADDTASESRHLLRVSRPSSSVNDLCKVSLTGAEVVLSRGILPSATCPLLDPAKVLNVELRKDSPGARSECARAGPASLVCPSRVCSAPFLSM